MKKIYLISVLIFYSAKDFAQNKIITRIESVESLYIETYKDNVPIMSATGFIIRSKTRNYLVTNYHVVTSKSPIDGKWMIQQIQLQITPNKIKIFENANALGEHVAKIENLISPNGDTLWHHTMVNGTNVDVIELALTDTSNTVVYPVNYSQTIDSLLVSPTDRVFIPGFPLGIKSASDLPVWKSGILASEPDLDQENRPVIWVDDLPFPGMSGSPVYLISDQVHYKNGTTTTFVGGSPTFFVGVFSHGDSRGVYGALWKGTYLKPIFDALP